MDVADMERENKGSEKKGERQGENNILLLGLLSQSLVDIGAALAQSMGFGCLNLETWLSANEKKTTSDWMVTESTEVIVEKMNQAFLDIEKVHNHIILIPFRLFRGCPSWPALKPFGLSVLLDFPCKKANSESPFSLEKFQGVDFSEIETGGENQQEGNHSLGISQVSEWICHNVDYIMRDQYSTAEDCARGLKQLFIRKVPSKVPRRKPNF